MSWFGYASEPWWVKILFIAAFLAAAAAAFFASAPLADWVKSSDSNLLVNFPTQRILAAPLAVLLFLVEERIM